MATKEELLEQAAALEIEGRSSMNKAELEEAISEAGGSATADADPQPTRIRPTGVRYRDGR